MSNYHRATARAREKNITDNGKGVKATSHSNISRLVDWADVHHGSTAKSLPEVDTKENGTAKILQYTAPAKSKAAKDKQRNAQPKYIQHTNVNKASKDVQTSLRKQAIGSTRDGNTLVVKNPSHKCKPNQTQEQTTRKRK